MTPTLYQLILIPIALEWVVWFLLQRFVRDVPRCPVCGGSFLWKEIALYQEQYELPRRTSFPCPKCQQIIGVPDWRNPFLRALSIGLYISSLFIFLAIAPAENAYNFALAVFGASFAALGGRNIADWFIWRKLEPGRPSLFS